MDIKLFLCKVNKVTSPHRHGQPISKSALDNLSNAQIELEASLKTEDAQKVKAEIGVLLAMVQYYVTPDGIGVEGSVKIIDKLRQLISRLA